MRTTPWVQGRVRSRCRMMVISKCHQEFIVGELVLVRH